MDKWRKIKEEKEYRFLSRFASKSVDSRGRVIDEEPCPIRTVFERDGNRIIHSSEFRRLRHKTQVFFNTQNDHICTRMEHVLNVSSIANIIARTLDLNQDLTYAIAMGHDLGHAPFGHTGERVINKCVQSINSKIAFHHENHSLRVVDRLATRISEQDQQHGLNLSYEVRDGIVSHCGEIFGEYKLKRDILKNADDIYITNNREHMPYTLEGCVVRLTDKIAYVGRDLEDAIRAGIIELNVFSKYVTEELGRTNSQIINTLVMDIIENSYDKDSIELSEEKGQALKELLTINNEYIYNSHKIKVYEKNTMNILESIFFAIYEIAKNAESVDKSNMSVVKNFKKFVLQMGYDDKETPEQKTIDFVAGMTDNYAVKCYEELFWI